MKINKALDKVFISKSIKPNLGVALVDAMIVLAH